MDVSIIRNSRKIKLTESHKTTVKYAFNCVSVNIIFQWIAKYPGLRELIILPG